jgi:hypothetical protein
MMIKEAAVRYGVSRTKLHRLVTQGRLRTAKDPRDERVTLLSTEDVESALRFSGEEGNDMAYIDTTENGGRLTPELLARMAALRGRIAARGKFSQDSAEIIREEREKRSRQVYDAVFGEGRYDADGLGQT